jgi:hypothetical protein
MAHRVVALGGDASAIQGSRAIPMTDLVTDGMTDGMTDG